MLQQCLQVYQFDKKIRCGCVNDGGYIIGELDGEYDCYISAGISNEESFSRDFINKYNLNEYNCFGFDGTISNYPFSYTKKISFINKNINSFNDDNNTNLSYLISKYENIFLKIDIEGGEYPWLLNINEKQLDKFKQIVIEFHGITDDSFDCKYDDKIKCLQKLANTHYIIHAHGNNNKHTVNNIPYVIELTYVNKRYFKSAPELNTQSLPIKDLDFPNHPNLDEINLNCYPFVKHTCLISPIISGIKYLIRNSKDTIQNTLLNGKQWNEEIINVIKKYTLEKNLSHFLNIGSHIGSVCLPISLCIKKVTAIEAYPDIYIHLCENIYINNLTNVNAMNIAVGNSEEDVYFISTEKICPIENKNRVLNNTGGMHFFTENDIKNNIRSANLSDKKIKNKINKLDNLQIDDFDIMLVDIEGLEYEFLLGAEQSIKKNKPIIIIEIWNNNKRKLENITQTQEEVINYIKSLKYTLIKTIDDDFIFEPLHNEFKITYADFNVVYAPSIQF